MTDSDKVTLKKASKTPLPDGQGRWYELLSPTQILTGEEKLGHDMNQQQQQQQIEGEAMKMKMKKKKCHGNRKEQHRRQRLRRQEEKQAKKDMNEETMNRIDHDMTVPNDGQHDVQKEEEKEGQLERMEVSCHLS